MPPLRSIQNTRSSFIAMGSYISTEAHTQSADDSETKEMQDFLSELPSQHLEPLWSQMNVMVPPNPNPTAKAHMWKYAEALPQLQKAGALVPEERAERRVLMLVNPSMQQLTLAQNPPTRQTPSTAACSSSTRARRRRAEAASRDSCSYIYHCYEGTGRTEVETPAGEKSVFRWTARDTFAVPAWSSVRHVNESPDQRAYLVACHDAFLSDAPKAIGRRTTSIYRQRDSSNANMAEIVGLVASSIALAQVVGKIGGGVLKLKRMWDEVKDVPEAIQDLFKRLDLILPVVARIARDIETGATVFEDMEAVESYILSCQQAISDEATMMNDLLVQIDATKRVRRVRDIVRVALKRDVLERHEKKLEVMIQILLLAHSEYSRACTKAIPTAVVQHLRLCDSDDSESFEPWFNSESAMSHQDLLQATYGLANMGVQYDSLCHIEKARHVESFKEFIDFITAQGYWELRLTSKLRMRPLFEAMNHGKAFLEVLLPKVSPHHYNKPFRHRLRFLRHIRFNMKEETFAFLLWHDAIENTNTVHFVFDHWTTTTAYLESRKQRTPQTAAVSQGLKRLHTGRAPVTGPSPGTGARRNSPANFGQRSKRLQSPSPELGSKSSATTMTNYTRTILNNFSPKRNRMIHMSDTSHHILTLPFTNLSFHLLLLSPANTTKEITEL
ncbi:hypothetical protein BN1723_009883 [Verticillium longisporum]|uniref:Fungal N-terminal domain-containing protein n=1 Tax=Verticillium longisporum TaxID=100787 RepID=A0A0G4KT50_VERLO|nr:hypothetical protein BN1723_009883 [Verticillium longisporum]